MADVADSCTFAGSVQTIRIEGVGPAVLTDNEAFAGAPRVVVIGARVGPGEPSSFTIERPGYFVPVSMNPRDSPYDVTYRAGSPVVVDIAKGGTNGSVTGPLANHPECASGGCDVIWSGPSKTIHLVPKDGPSILASGFAPTGSGLAANKPFVREIAVTGATGEVRCALDGHVAKLSNADRVFRAGAHRMLSVSDVKLEHGQLRVAVRNEAPPQWPVRLKYEAGLASVASVIALGVGIVLARRRRRPVSSPIPAPRPGPGPGTMSYDAFLSHASEDKRRVFALAKALRKRGVSVWLDAERIRPGDSISEKIEDGLRQSRFLLVCLSRHLKRSRWMRAEYAPILHNELKAGGARVIPVVVDDFEDGDVPMLLSDKARADARTAEGLEGLAAKLRGEPTA